MPMATVYKLRHLTGNRLKTFLAVADRIIPADDDAPGGGTMLTAGIVDWALDKMPAPLRKKFLLFITVIGLSGYLFSGKPFSKCSPETQDRILKWLENNPLRLFRMGFFGVKTYVCMGYYTREDIWKTFEYDGPVVSERPYVDSAIREMCKGKVEVIAPV
ncbi:MAG: hypothetical protein KatS3mg031_0979 [Chitinophagales bacterium]|nr:MAG: hypothetical protein KatS3mg031_0979 [Chitinophagales bacterium]